MRVTLWAGQLILIVEACFGEVGWKQDCWALTLLSGMLATHWNQLECSSERFAWVTSFGLLSESFPVHFPLPKFEEVPFVTAIRACSPLRLSSSFLVLSHFSVLYRPGLPSAVLQVWELWEPVGAAKNVEVGVHVEASKHFQTFQGPEDA